MYADAALREFAAQLASGNPVPGGGGAAAYCAAMGAGLAAMVCQFTIGREKFAAVDTEFRDLLARFDLIREELVKLVDDDSEAFTEFSRASRMPRVSESDRNERSASIQLALVDCARTPLRVASLAEEGLRSCRLIADQGNPNLVSDAGVAALFLDAAMRAAILNVRVNLRRIRDSATRDELSAAIAALEATASDQLASTMTAVKARME